METQHEVIGNCDAEPMLRQSGSIASDTVTARSVDLPLQHAERASSSIDCPDGDLPPDAKPFELADFSNVAPSAEATTLQLVRDVQHELKIELGRTHMHLDDVLNLKHGAVVPLDKLAGDPVDLHINGRLIARGELLVLNDDFCVRVTELVAGETAV